MEMHARGGGAGVSLSVNKRLASDKTRTVLGWAPTRYDILADVEHGSYARAPKGASRHRRPRLYDFRNTGKRLCSS